MIVSAIDWQTLFPIKSVPAILCADNTEKEMVSSALATARCPCRWRGTENVSETELSLAAGLHPSSVPQKGKVCDDGPHFSGKINSINKKVQNVRHVFIVIPYMKRTLVMLCEKANL